MLRDKTWRIRYTPDDGDLVRLFYIPALQDAVRYHRLTGYFNAGALALAARGIEGLVRNNGQARLLVGCTLEAEEIAAIERGEALREQVEWRLARLPLAPPDAEASGALELVAWMIGRGHLDVKVAVPCNAEGVPVPDGTIFHEKAGIVEDGVGDRIAWNGSLKETPAGWQRNWESVHVYASWEDPARVQTEEENFARLWANRSPRLNVLDVPSAVRQDLMRFLPKDDLPRRLQPEPSAGGLPPGDGVHAIYGHHGLPARGSAAGSGRKAHVELRPLGHREHGLRMAGMTEFVRVTTNPAYYEEHAESVELWSPGSAVFRVPEGLGEPRSHPSESLSEILREAIPPRAVCK